MDNSENRVIGKIINFVFTVLSGLFAYYVYYQLIAPL